MAAQSIPLTQARSTPATRIDPIEGNVAHHLFGQQGYGFRAFFLTRMNDRFAAPPPGLNFTRTPSPRASRSMTGSPERRANASPT